MTVEQKREIEKNLLQIELLVVQLQVYIDTFLETGPNRNNTFTRYNQVLYAFYDLKKTVKAIEPENGSL